VCYPNPFNNSVTFRYSLSNEARVSLKVYSLLGREMATLVDRIENAGAHTAVFVPGHTMPGGLYFYCISAGDRQRTGILHHTKQ
jgi:hypothetical protein